MAVVLFVVPREVGVAAKRDVGWCCAKRDVGICGQKQDGKWYMYVQLVCF